MSFEREERKIVSVSMPGELLQRIDHGRGDVARSVWIRRASESALSSESALLNKRRSDNEY